MFDSDRILHELSEEKQRLDHVIRFLEDLSARESRHLISAPSPDARQVFIDTRTVSVVRPC